MLLNLFITTTLATNNNQIFNAKSANPAKPLYTYQGNAPNGYDSSRTDTNPVVKNMEIIKDSTLNAIASYLNEPQDDLLNSLNKIKQSASTHGIKGVKEGYYNAEPNMDGIKKYDMSLTNNTKGSYLETDRSIVKQLIVFLDASINAKKEGKDSNILKSIITVIKYYDDHKDRIELMLNKQ